MDLEHGNHFGFQLGFGIALLQCDTDLVYEIRKLCILQFIIFRCEVDKLVALISVTFG